MELNAEQIQADELVEKVSEVAEPLIAKYKEVYKDADSWSNSPEDWYINGGRFASAGVTFRY